MQPQEILNLEVFLESKDRISLQKALIFWAEEFSPVRQRRDFFKTAEIHPAFTGKLHFEYDAQGFAMELVAEFSRYSFDRNNSDYHPLVAFLKYLGGLFKQGMYDCSDNDKTLFEQLLAQGQEKLKALTARSTVGRIESPKGTGIGTGVLIGKNWLLTCDHIFSKSRAQQAWVRFNYTPNSYGLDSDVFELDLNGATRSSREDYALIPVKSEPKQQTAIAIDAILDSRQKIRLIHHPQGQHVVVSELGQIVQVGEDYIDHNISTDKGSSGAPIFNRDWQLVAIHRGHPGTGAGRNLAPGTTSGLPLHSFWTEIQSHLS